MSNNKLVIGALLGGALAAASYALLSSKSRKTLRNTLSDTCEDIGDTVGKFVHDLKESLSDNFEEGATQAKKKINFVQHELSSMCHLNGMDTKQGILAGALIGALVGTCGTMLFKSKPEESSTLDTIAEQACKWKNIVADVLEVLNRKRATQMRNPSNRVHDMLDLATSGIQLWQNLQKR